MDIKYISYLTPPSYKNSVTKIRANPHRICVQYMFKQTSLRTKLIQISHKTTSFYIISWLICVNLCEICGLFSAFDYEVYTIPMGDCPYSNHRVFVGWWGQIGYVFNVHPFFSTFNSSLKSSGFNPFTSTLNSSTNFDIAFSSNSGFKNASCLNLLYCCYKW